MIKSELVERIKDGFIQVDTDDIIDSMLHGNSIDNVFLTDTKEKEKYYEVSKHFNVKYMNLDNKPKDLSQMSEKWFIPTQYLNIDVVEYLVSKCKTNVEFQRVSDELVEFNKRDQLIILNLMIYIVDVMRENNIVWGIGRGSSVASFCLYLIGINKVNPLEYDIDYREFLK